MQLQQKQEEAWKFCIEVREEMKRACRHLKQFWKVLHRTVVCFVPQALPSFDKTLDEFAQMDYRQTAYEVMKLLLTDFTEEELRYCIDKAYDGKFDTGGDCPAGRSEKCVVSGTVPRSDDRV